MIGRVHDLIVEMDTRQVRYIDVAAGTDAKGDYRGERHVLVPIGLARLVDDCNVVSIGTLTGDELLSPPAYEHKPFTRDKERELVGRLLGSGESAADTSGFYRHAFFAMTGFWGARRDVEEGLSYDVVEIDTAGGSDC